MLEELQKAEALLKPLVARVEAYKGQNGRKGGTLLSKVRNAYLRTKEAIATIESVVEEARTLDTSSAVEQLTAQPAKSK